ncbi:MAG: hypothetical protein VB878_01575 [Pirellulaceae bacterium]
MVHDEFEDDLSDVEFEEDLGSPSEDESKPKKKRVKKTSSEETGGKEKKRARRPAKSRRTTKKKVKKADIADEPVEEDSPQVDDAAEETPTEAAPADVDVTSEDDKSQAEAETEAAPEPEPEPEPEEVEPEEPDNIDAAAAIKDVGGRVDLNKFGRVWRVFLYERNTDADVAQIHGLPMLKEIWLLGTKVTQEGYEKVKEAFPDAKIYF